MTAPDDDRSLADELRAFANTDPETLFALLPLDIDELLEQMPQAVTDGELSAELAAELNWRLRRLQDILPRAVSEPVMAMEAERLFRDVVQLVVDNMTVGDRADRAAEKIVTDCKAYFAKVSPSEMDDMALRFVRNDIADTIRRTQ